MPRAEVIVTWSNCLNPSGFVETSKPITLRDNRTLLLGNDVMEIKAGTSPGFDHWAYVTHPGGLLGFLEPVRVGKISEGRYYERGSLMVRPGEQVQSRKFIDPKRSSPTQLTVTVTHEPHFWTGWFR